MLANDRAGNEGVSPIVRVPPDGATGVGLPADGRRWVPDGSAAAAAAADRTSPQARIDYVNTLEFNVDYTVERMGPSGVQAAHLFVLKNQGELGAGQDSTPSSSCPATRTRRSSLPYRGEGEGTYGFYVIPESGAGKRADDPRRGDRAMVHVVVDTTAPYVQITGVQVGRAALAGRWSRSPGRRPTRT